MQPVMCMDASQSKIPKVAPFPHVRRLCHGPGTGRAQHGGAVSHGGAGTQELANGKGNSNSNLERRFMCPGGVCTVSARGTGYVSAIGPQLGRAGRDSE
jgi:hypothetical protein